MALSVKPVPIAAPPGATTSTRVVTGPRAGGSAALAGPVESVSSISGSTLSEGSFFAVVSQDDNEFSGRSFTPGQRREDGDDLPNPKTGIIEFTSQGFAQLIELRDTVSAGSDSSGGSANRDKAGGRGIEYASALYEAVVDAATGNKNILGETVSLTL